MNNNEITHLNSTKKLVQDTLVTEKTSSISPKQKIALNLVVARLKKINKGRLTITFLDQRFEFGEAIDQAKVNAEINIHNPEAFSDIVAKADLGAAEAYIRGDWDSPDLISVIRLTSLNLNVISEVQRVLLSPLRLLRFTSNLFKRNSHKGARKNIAAHYDLSNKFFSSFLDPTMMYSSSIYPNRASGLEVASNFKMQRICEKLELRESDHLLEIGTGWGSLALYAARNYGCRVTTTTISKEQHSYASNVIEEAGLSERITLLRSDYRDLEGVYDKVVSVEMIEAVGHQYYEQYFRACSNLLKADGLMLIQAITIADQRYKQALKLVDFIQQYIFPGGCLPSNEVISKHIAQDTDMQLVELHDITTHYADTLAAWRERFWRNIEEIKSLGFDNEFCRMWNFYLVYCEGGFRERVISTGQYLMAKPGYRYP